MRARRSYYFLAFAILPFLFVLQNPAFIEPVHGFSLAVFKPVLMAGHSAANVVFDTRTAIVRFWKTFHAQGAQETRISQLEAELVQLKEVQKENERLRKLVNFRSTVAGKTIAARIIGWDASTWRKTFLLDKGTTDGIRNDMSVLSYEGLVGRVIEAGPSTSRVLLLTDADARVGAITDTSRATGVAGGNGSSRLSMSYLELDSGVQVGEIVLSSGMGGLFPKGLRIGKIVALSKDSTGLHLEAEVESFIRFSKLEEVLCLASSQPK